MRTLIITPFIALSCASCGDNGAVVVPAESIANTASEQAPESAGTTSMADEESARPLPELQDRSETDSGLIECASITGTTERLGCYDELAIVRGYRPPLTSHRGTGKWHIEETSNPMDDTRRVTLILTAEPNSSRSRMRQLPVLVARCQSDTTELYINWDQYVGDDSSSVYDEWKYVTIRIGGGEANRQRWSVSTNRQSTFAPGWAGNLLRQMATENSLVVRITPYGENPMTAIFDTTGLEEALVPLMDACGWSLANGGDE
jgi:type VI secretion system (T6SS) VasI/EvfG family protein